jgi:hypothetical protein
MENFCGEKKQWVTLETIAVHKMQKVSIYFVYEGQNTQPLTAVCS